MNNTFNLLKCALSGNESDVLLHEDVMPKFVDWKEQFVFFNNHAIAPLVSGLNQYVPDNNDVKKEWKESTYSNIYTYYNLVKKQNQILDAFKANRVPVVVVKGTSAAKYYPKPQLRTMGDIDLLVRPENFETAVTCLMNISCVDTTGQEELEADRHKSFRYDNVSVEIHKFFSPHADSEEEKKLDSMLLDAISPNNTELPDEENGLVLLSHIRQHLEGGLGLRQIFDWFMFVKSCLNDEVWYSSYQEKARVTGLETLAIIATRMCQLYLGLTTDITWCKEADEKNCNDLLQYVIECGNFGRSREMFKSRSASELPPIENPIKLLTYIQSHGERNWKALKRHPCLKPFAWIYQSCRYTKMAVQNKVGAKKLKSIYDEGKKRNELFSALGLK